MTSIKKGIIYWHFLLFVQINFVFYKPLHYLFKKFSVSIIKISGQFRYFHVIRPLVVLSYIYVIHILYKIYPTYVHTIHCIIHEFNRYIQYTYQTPTKKNRDSVCTESTMIFYPLIFSYIRSNSALYRLLN